MIAGTLEIQMLTGIARLQTDMNQAKSIVGGAVQQMETAVAKLKSAFSTLGVGLGIGIFTSMIKGSIDALDHLRDVSKATGILVQDLAGLTLLAKQTGTDFDGLTKGINKMSVEIGKAPEKFQALGVTAKDIVGQFKQLADIFNLLPDINQRNALAMAIFGKSWAEIAPALAEGSKNIAEIIEKGKRLSGVTDEMTDRADEFNDKLAELQMQIGGTRTAIASALLPALTALVDNFTLVKDVILSLIAAKLAGWAAASVKELLATAAASKAAAAAALEKAQADVAATAITAAARVREAQANVATAASTLALNEARIAELRAAAIAAGGNELLAITLNGIIPLQAKATAASIAHQAALSMQAPAQVKATAAAAAHATALEALAVAQRAAAAGSGVATSALGLLGGPIGAITLLLGLGATAWSVWGKSAEDAADKADDAVNRGLSIAKRLQNQDKFGSGDTGALQEALAGAKQVLDAELANFAEAQRAVTNDSRLGAEAIARDLALVEKSYAGAVKKATDNITTLEGAIKKSAAGAGEMTDAQKKAADAAAKFLKQDEKATKGVADAVAGLILQLKKELDALNSIEGESADYNKLVREITEGTKKWTDAQIAHALALQGEIDDIKRAKKETEDYIKEFKAASDLRKEAQKEEAEAMTKMADARKDFILSSHEELDLSREAMQVARLEVSLMNATEAERTKQIELLKAELAVRRQINQAINAGANLTDEDRDFAERNARQAALNRALAQQVKDEAAAGLKVQVDMWQTVERTAHDTFISIFDSGKNAFERLRDTLKNTLFDLLYQMTIKKWIINVAASVSGAGAASSAFGSTGGGGGIGDLLSLGSSANSLFGGTSPLSSLGNLFGLGSGTAATGSAMAANIASATSLGVSEGLITAVSEFGGSLAAGSGGAAVAANASVAGGATVGLGATLGTVIPIIGAAVAAYFLLHKDKISATSTGDMGRTFGPGGAVTSEWQGQFGTGAGGAQLDTLFGRFNQIATALGATFEQVGFYLGGNTGREGKDPQGRIQSSIGGRTVFDTGAEIPQAQMELAASRAILAALQGSNLPDYLSLYLNSLTVGTLDQAGIDAALNFAASLKALHDQLTETRTPIEIARDQIKSLGATLGTSAASTDAWKTALVAAMDAGINPESLAGWQALGVAIETVNQIIAEAGAARAQLLDRFSTEAERTARAQEQVTDAFTAFGATVPETRSELAALIASLDENNVEHHQYIAGLNAIADALDMTLPELEEFAEVVEETGNQLAVINKRNELTIRLLELQGDAVGALNIRRMLEYEAVGQLDQSLLPLLKEIYGLEDAATAAAAAADTAADALATHAEAIRDAQQMLRDAYQAEIAEKENIISRMGGYVESLRLYREQLTFNDAALSPEDRYAGTAARFQQTLSRASLGDMDAIGIFQQVSEDFREASRAYNASTPAFFEDLNRIIAGAGSVEGVASRTVDVAQLQLTALEQQRDAILGVETAVLGVTAAIANLEAKIIASGASNSEGNAAMLDAIRGVTRSVDTVERAVRTAAA